MKSRVVFSSATVEWATPRGVYEALHDEFAFTLDPCPLGGTEDGLSTLFCSWENHRVFCNPSYGPEIRKWLERWREAEVAVYLLPARVDTRWFHDIVLPHASEIRFIRGRLRFGGAVNSAPFPSMLVVFRSIIGTSRQDAINIPQALTLRTEEDGPHG